jgi:hypothetical protein
VSKWLLGTLKHTSDITFSYTENYDIRNPLVLEVPDYHNLHCATNSKKDNKNNAYFVSDVFLSDMSQKNIHSVFMLQLYVEEK